MSIDAIQKVHGAGSRCNKSQELYSLLTTKGELNLDSIGNREDHRRRRQVWDKAMNSKCKSQTFETGTVGG